MDIGPVIEDRVQKAEPIIINIEKMIADINNELSKLKQLGYNDREINNFKHGIWNALITNNISNFRP